jgi:predicted methyltransferase
MRASSTTLAIVLAVLSASPSMAQDKSVKPGINKSFENPDVGEYVKRFETESREVFTRREAIVEALGLRPGMAVADVGAGTGLFTRLVADRVGPRGKVYAVDIAPAFLKHIATESKNRGQGQVETVLGQQDTTNLPPNSVDLAFLCDAYHHLEFPAKTLASLHRALRAGGRLVVIDFDRREGVSTAFVLEHVRAGKEVFLAEIEAAGFERIDGGPRTELKENFFLSFRKKGAPGEVPKAPRGERP